MTLLQLHYFQSLARVLHYTRTAQEFHVSQPSVSYAIGELEKELGVKLFQKEKQKVELTVFGRQFLLYVEQSLGLLEEGKRALEQTSRQAPKVVRLGYFNSISSSLIPSVVEGFYREQESREGIMFQFSENTPGDIFDQIQSGDVDLGFCLHQTDLVHSVEVMRQPLYLAVSTHHPLAGRSSVTFSDFANEPQVVLEHSTNLRAKIDEIFELRRTIPNIVFEVRECNAALQYVGLQFGVSIVPHIPAMESDKISVIPISDRDQEFFRPVYLIWSKTRPLSLAAERVRNYVVETYTETSKDSKQAM